MLIKRRLPLPSMLASMLSLILPSLASGCGVDAPAADDAGAPLAPASLLAPAVVGITVHDAAGPIKGALMVLRAPVTPEEFAPGLLWQALTDDEGTLRALLPLRSDQQEIDVIVQHPGWDGPWSDQAKRAAAGEFAPCSWQRVPVSQLGSLSISLTKRQP